MSSKSVIIILLSFTLALQLGCIAAEGKLEKFSKFHVRHEIISVITFHSVILDDI